MFNVSRGLISEIGNELFQFRNLIPYKLRQRSQFQNPLVYSVFSGAKGLTFFGSEKRELIPNEMAQGSREF